MVFLSSIQERILFLYPSYPHATPHHPSQWLIPLDRVFLQLVMEFPIPVEPKASSWLPENLVQFPTDLLS